MTPDLEKLEALAKAATPGPWVWYNGCSWWRMHSEIDPRKSTPVLEPFTAKDGHPDLVCSEDDRVFIAAAREAFPALIARVKELGAALKPFSDKADECAACIATSKCGDSYKVEIELGHLRTANQILKGIP